MKNYPVEMLLKKTGMIEVFPLPLSTTCLAPDIFAACLVTLSRLVTRGLDLFFELAGLSGVLKWYVAMMKILPKLTFGIYMTTVSAIIQQATFK